MKTNRRGFMVGLLALCGAGAIRRLAPQAFPWDGVMDATPWIQAKIDAACAAGGGIVELAPGSYRLLAPLALRSYVRLDAAGSVSRPEHAGPYFL